MLAQARERQQEAEERLSLLEEQLAVKEKTFALMEADLDKVCQHVTRYRTRSASVFHRGKVR